MHDVIHVDGIHLGRNIVVLIALTPGGEALGWSIAPTETARAWSDLFANIAPPAVVACDGGSGIRKALREYWPGARVQRCLFHVLLNTTTLITSHPRLPASKELRNLVLRLQHVKTQEQANAWIHAYLIWHHKWDSFLKETGNRKDDPYALMHERLVQAARQLDQRIKEESLFTFLDPAILGLSGIPAFNNTIESFNARLRGILRFHRGMGREHQLKAIAWYCYTHCPNPVPLEYLPTDSDIQALRDQGALTPHQQTLTGTPEYGTGIVWTDFHSATPLQRALPMGLKTAHFLTYNPEFARQLSCIRVGAVVERDFCQR